MIDRLRKILYYRFETQQSRCIALVAVCIIEAILVVQVWKHSEATVLAGFVVKHGGGYVLVWKNVVGYRSEMVASLQDALSRARELGLGVAHSPSNSLESLWVQDRFGTYVVLWKLEEKPILNQLTFYDQKDASFFARAFKTGGYSPSPFGHSIFLTPIRTN